MTSITSATTTTSTTSSSTSSTSSSASTAYNTFLTLLCTQLTHQDPTNPTDANEFTSELIQLAGIEQMESMNSQLSTLVDSVSLLTASNGIGYIGKTVSWEGDTAPLQDGTASWNYTVPADAASVTLTITDSEGNTVYSTSAETSEGTYSLDWDGIASDGTTTYASGDFTLTVTAKDKAGSALTTSTTAKGTVTAVDSSSGTATLDVGGVSVSLDEITSVSAS